VSFYSKLTRSPRIDFDPTLICIHAQVVLYLREFAVVNCLDCSFAQFRSLVKLPSTLSLSSGCLSSSVTSSLRQRPIAAPMPRDPTAADGAERKAAARQHIEAKLGAEWEESFPEQLPHEWGVNALEYFQRLVTLSSKTPGHDSTFLRTLIVEEQSGEGSNKISGGLMKRVVDNYCERHPETPSAQSRTYKRKGGGLAISAEGSGKRRCAKRPRLSLGQDRMSSPRIRAVRRFSVSHWHSYPGLMRSYGNIY